MQAVPMDDQPVSSRFFGEGKWLSEFITPEALEVMTLHERLTKGVDGLEDRIYNCWLHVAEYRYKQFISGTLRVENKVERQDDLWCDPSLTIRTQIGNCANKAFLLTSLLRRDLDVDHVFCALGNLHDNGSSGGHAWCQVNLGGTDYIVESTRPDVPYLVAADIAKRYELVHLFNDERFYAIEGKTVMEPFSAAYSPWLKDYLDWAYIEGGGEKYG